MVGRCQGRHIWRKLDYRDILCNGNRVLYSRSLIFPVIGKTVSDFLKGRIKRVAIPYWKYALVCFPAVVYHYWKSGEIIPLNDFISYVFFTPTVEYRLFDHIWFIPPYLIISLCLPFFAGWFAGVIYLLSFSVSFWYCCYCSSLLSRVASNCNSLSVFYDMGIVYKKKLGWQIVVCVIAAVGYLIYAFGVERVPFDLQANKFPPNLLFASYGMAV